MKESYIILKDKLNGEYKEAFDKVEVYGTTNLMSSNELDERLMELLDSLMLAQQEKIDVAKVVGRDTDRFCQEFYSDYGVGDRLKAIPDFFCRMSWAFLMVAIFDILDLVLSEEKGSIMDPSSLAPFFVGMLGGFIFNAIVYFVIRPIYSKNKNAKFANSLVNIFIIVDLVIVIAIALSDICDKIFPVGIPILYELLFSVIYLTVFYAIRMVLNYKKNGSIFAPKKEKIKFSDAINDSMKMQMPVFWLERFDKKNERRERKGKLAISEEEYLKTIEKNVDYKKARISNILIFSSITLLSIVVMFITNGVDTIVDGMIAYIEVYVNSFFE